MGEFWTNTIFFGAVVSLLAYEVGLLAKRKLKLAIFNPLLIAVCCVMAINALFGVDYQTYNEGAKYLSYLMTPATVCLAVPMYEQIHLLKQNKKAILCAISAGVLVGAVGILLLSVLFGLNHQQYVTLLPKSITTAIGMGVSEELGGMMEITAATIIVTGIFGNVAAEAMFRLLNIKEPVARGLALGNSAHAIGTAKAMELGEAEGAMSSLAIVVAGVLTVICASVFANFL